jgi:hypothetical protein
MPAVRSIAGPIAAPGTPAPASTGAPRTAIACGRALPPSLAGSPSRLDFRLKISPVYCARRSEIRASRAETLRIWGDKPLKSLSAKWRHFAESLLFKGLIAFLFRRFPLAALRAIRAVQNLAISRARLIIADNSEKRNILLRSLDKRVPPRHCMRVMTPALRIIRICIISR